METLQIEILNPKAKSILQSLADLKLISIQKEKKQEFIALLKKLRANSDTAPSYEEITAEVEAVRSKRYDENEETLWLKFAGSCPSFSFLMDKEEDVYSIEDGEPFHD